MLSNIILIEIITILYMKTSIKYDYPFCHYVNTRNVQSELEYTCSVPINETLTNGHGHYFINVYVQSQRRWKDKFFVGIKHSKGINGYTGPKELNKDKPYSRSWFSCNQEALPPSAALPNAPDLVTTDCELVLLSLDILALNS
ncbi:uncharacterized protein MONOS_13482 [Monocercomonoides exilis]|uniref:uncharacterized protein n=1 Tax=Monocercomonoides exilis TaxID=2049356 RepID=UPI00355A2F0B|nr:hypothetical protein MONOS_13482 [Monocercomonoides exilis]|eukprot:MONOS_13482.1-p1 / transcript=MONOS_13482.1 / gene=MONOS_13482 / organism=Monocercomonoides_exilis_PA203 / gene_product=unspecified product / transcript_product=unspecified product / location=Mono_scaffold00835:12903-13706(+) / protein_length=143 / sequence_SO=supercontig / SO=protein_coding / is_pseudo=false